MNLITIEISHLSIKKFLSGLKKSLKKLAKQPFIGTETNDPETRMLIWNNHYIFYEIYDGYIAIEAIYHQKENINK